MSSVWKEINQQQSAEESARQAEIDRRQTAQQRANERRDRMYQIFTDSGVIGTLRGVQEGLPQDSRNRLEVGGGLGFVDPTVTRLTFGVSDTDCRQIEVRIDDQRDEIVVMKAGTPRWQGDNEPPTVEQRISREQWKSDPSAVETAIASAYLHPSRSVSLSREPVKTPTPPPPPERPKNFISRWLDRQEETRRENGVAEYEFYKRDDR